jgi:hypothetical protein
VKIVTDLSYKAFYIDTADIDPYYDYIDIEFVFLFNGNPEVVFEGLSFEYSVSYGETVMSSEKYPKDNIEYISNGQEYLELSRVFGFRPNRNYKVDILVNHSNDSFSDSIIFEVPKLKQPYKSWIWNDELIKWDPPVPYPDDENFYTWNEEDQSWDIYIPEEES